MSRGNTIKTRIAALLGSALLGTAVLPALGPASALADAATLYVNNAAGAHCTDSGTGTQAAPFCHIKAAAAVVQPGQTVQVLAGEYDEGGLTVTAAGTAQAPITFSGPDLGDYQTNSTVVITNTSVPSADGLTVKGQHLRFKNLSVNPTGSGQAVVANGAEDVSFRTVTAFMGGIRITNQSKNVSFGQSQSSYPKGASVVVDGGSTGTVLASLSIFAQSMVDPTGFRISDAPSTTIVNNTIHATCGTAMQIQNGSTGATVENNLVTTIGGNDQACPAGSPALGLSVAADSVSGTKADYNTLAPNSSFPVYDWAGTAYATQAAFTAATGQGAHDYVTNYEQLWQYHPGQSRSPLVDSADENVPGILPVDAYGRPAVDDPVVTNTGTGTGTRDRGAAEFEDFGSLFSPAGPTRLLDTRAAIGVPAAKPVAARGTVDLQVAGVAGIPAGITAVTLNVTVTEPGTDGHLTVYPHGDEMPTASNLNWTAGTTIPNLVTVPVKDGKVSFYNASDATVHVVADLAGYYSSKGSTFNPAGPTRLLDTRAPIGVPTAKAVAPRGTVDLQVAGVAGVPAGVTAITLNVTVTEPGTPGHLTVYPHGQAAPNASNLNWTAGQTIPNLVTVPVKDGKVSFYNASDATVQVIADLAGYYTTTGDISFRPDGPWRIMDTRVEQRGSTPRDAGPIAPRGTLELPLEGPFTDGAIVLNVTVTEPGTDGHLTVYPHGQAAPNASNLNWTAGQTIANQVVVPVKDGRISFYNASDSTIHLVVDQFGYYGH
ncbi:right-handed parallel beta-helix repeat-containing protein [Kitasatospora sp. NPDC049285]|uniref:right-handed parallel beta-helix repeat-containing protein n=1 Tax=Kitasatospora sp. NPDC049285 TaxID=3157096 RepID=UPI00342DDA6B